MSHVTNATMNQGIGSPQFNRTNFATLSPRGGLFGNNPFSRYERTSEWTAQFRQIVTRFHACTLTQTRRMLGMLRERRSALLPKHRVNSGNQVRPFGNTGPSTLSTPPLPYHDPPPPPPPPPPEKPPENPLPPPKKLDPPPEPLDLGWAVIVLPQLCEADIMS
jgi:hypothetical protein